MAIELTDLKSIYDEFLTKGMEELAKLQKETQMEDEHLSTAASSIIATAMGSSIQAISTLKNIELLNKDLLIKDQQEITEKIKNGGIHYEYTYNDDGEVTSRTLIEGTGKSIYEYQSDLVVSQIASSAQQKASMIVEDGIKTAQSTKDLSVKDAQISMLNKQVLSEAEKMLDIKSTTLVRNAQHAKDMLIKDQQEIAEKIKNGGVHYVYTYDANGVVLTKTLVTGTTKSIHEYQTDKMLADTNFVKEQKTQLGYSVTYNNRLKVSENFGDMIGNLGLGGLNISSAMWTTYFTMLNDVYTNYGEVPTTKTISVPAATALVLTKIA